MANELGVRGVAGEKSGCTMMKVTGIWQSK